MTIGRSVSKTIDDAAWLGGGSSFAEAPATVGPTPRLQSSLGGGLPTAHFHPRVALNHNFSLFVCDAANGCAVAGDIFSAGRTLRDDRAFDKKLFIAYLSVGIGFITEPRQATRSRMRRTQDLKKPRDGYSPFSSVTLRPAC